jgi:pimeloyl-ACP methyl ester carboxylesterase
MTGTAEATLTRARPRDGTEIGYWSSGQGPPLVLVHGAVADHTRWRPLLPYLEPHAHLAHRGDPAMVAAVIRAFVSGSAAASGARPGAGTRPR